MGKCNCQTEYFKDVLLYKYKWKLSSSEVYTLDRVLNEFIAWKQEVQSYCDSLFEQCNPSYGSGSPLNEWEITYVIQEPIQQYPDNLLEPPDDSGLDDYEDEVIIGVSSAPAPIQLNKKCPSDCIETGGGDLIQKILLKQLDPINGELKAEESIPVTFKFKARIFKRYRNCIDGRSFDEFFENKDLTIGPIVLRYELMEYKWDYLYKYRYIHYCP
jgi:hypothetical protein